MNDPDRVHGVEGGEELEADRDRVVDAEALATHEDAPERLTEEALHDEERRAASGRPVVEDGADVGVMDRRDDARLALEAARLDRIAREAERDLHRDEATEPLVVRLIHDRAAAASDLVRELVTIHEHGAEGGDFTRRHGRARCRMDAVTMR